MHAIRALAYAAADMIHDLQDRVVTGAPNNVTLRMAHTWDTKVLEHKFSLWKDFCIVSTSEQPTLVDTSTKFPPKATTAERAFKGLSLLHPIAMCKVWTRPCSECRREMMLSGSSTSETHKGHREPCATYRRLRAERGDSWTKCDQEVSEQWHGTGGVRKCDICMGVTREQAIIRRTTRRKAKMAARKKELENKMAAREQELENKWDCHKYRNIASAISIEAAEAADNVNSFPPMQAQEPMIYYQDTVVTSEPSMPRYGERQSDEDVAWNSIADTIASEASQHEAAQVQPVKEEEEVKEEERGIKDSVELSPGSEIEHQYSPTPPHDQPCSCGAQRHEINIHRECLRRADVFSDALFFAQFTTKAFEYDPMWKAECGAVMSAREQDDVWREYLKAKEEVFEEVGGKEDGKGG